jgi:hypothetical protein
VKDRKRQKPEDSHEREWRREAAQSGQVLNDRDHDCKQGRTDRAGQIGRVVDAKRVDPEQGGARLDKELRRVSRPVRVAIEALVGPPVDAPARPNQNRFAAQIAEVPSRTGLRASPSTS